VHIFRDTFKMLKDVTGIRRRINKELKANKNNER